MNILVTGANGQLGREMRLVAQGSSHRYVFADVAQAEGLTTQPLDITDAQAVAHMVEREAIDAIVNCAAYTNVEAAETQPQLAARLNADAPEILAQTMAQRGGLLLHISTDYVFGAEPYNTPCREDQQGTPTGVYGHTKLWGEQRIRAVGGKHVIVRTAWLYSEWGRNFCLTMLGLTASKPQLRVVIDQAGTPTYALDLARAIAVILDDYATTGHGQSTYAHTGTYHYSNEGVCSWYDFAHEIARIAGHTQCHILPCHSSEYPSAVKRPAYSVLDKTRIKSTFGLDIPHWTTSLQACIRNIEQTQYTHL